MTRIVSIAFSMSFSVLILVLPQTASSSSSVSNEKPSALTGELGILKNGYGGVSTELSMTVEDPRLNKGRPTNIPLLVKGQVNVKDLLRSKHPNPSKRQYEIAIGRAIERVAAGADLPSYDSMEAAVAAAEARSRSGASIEHFNKMGKGKPESNP